MVPLRSRLLFRKGRVKWDHGSCSVCLRKGTCWSPLMVTHSSAQIRARLKSLGSLAFGLLGTLEMGESHSSRALTFV